MTKLIDPSIWGKIQINQHVISGLTQSTAVHSTLPGSPKNQLRAVSRKSVDDRSTPGPSPTPSVQSLNVKQVRPHKSHRAPRQRVSHSGKETRRKIQSKVLLCVGVMAPNVGRCEACQGAKSGPFILKAYKARKGGGTSQTT